MRFCLVIVTELVLLLISGTFGLKNETIHCKVANSVLKSNFMKVRGDTGVHEYEYERGEHEEELIDYKITLGARVFTQKL